VTVYVDDMRANFGRMIMCHMFADTEAELHAMAASIGVARRWYQGDHYDIALSKRAAALANGACAVSYWEQTGAMMMVRRMTGVFPRPENCKEIFHFCYGLIQRSADTGA
jgi:hypothetical protein